MKRALALLLASATAMADPPEAKIDAPPPEKSGVLVWVYEGKKVSGVFVPETQAVRVTERLWRTEKELEDCRTDNLRNSVPWGVWLGAGAVIGLLTGVSMALVIRRAP